MRLPYVQVDMEVLEQSAPEVAILLGCSEDAALAALVRLIPWALARCPDHEPPSANAVVRGAHAARLIAAGARWPGDADAFVDALGVIRFPMLERVDGGVRVRGLDRYDEAWRTQQGRSARGRAAAQKRWGNAQAMPDGCSGNATAMPDACAADAGAMPGDAQIQTQTQTQKKKGAARERASLGPPADESLMDRLTGIFFAKRGTGYALGRNDEAALRVLLVKARQACPADPEGELERRWSRALDWRGYPSCSSFSELASDRCWNAYAQEQPPAAAGPPRREADPKRGVVRVDDNDWGTPGVSHGG